MSARLKSLIDVDHCERQLGTGQRNRALVRNLGLPPAPVFIAVVARHPACVLRHDQVALQAGELLVVQQLFTPVDAVAAGRGDLDNKTGCVLVKGVLGLRSAAHHHVGVVKEGVVADVESQFHVGYCHPTGRLPRRFPEPSSDIQDDAVVTPRRARLGVEEARDVLVLDAAGLLERQIVSHIEGRRPDGSFNHAPSIAAACDSSALDISRQHERS